MNENDELNQDLNIDSLNIVESDEEKMEKPLSPEELLNQYTKFEEDKIKIHSDILRFKEEHSDIFNELQKLNDLLIDCENKQTDLKTEMTSSMSSTNIKSIQNTIFKVTYVAPATKTTFNTKDFKSSHPDLFEKYSTTSIAKDYVRITEIKK